MLALVNAAIQSQKAVSAYLKSKQILPFDFVRQNVILAGLPGQYMPRGAWHVLSGQGQHRSLIGPTQICYACNLNYKTEKVYQFISVYSVYPFDFMLMLLLNNNWLYIIPLRMRCIFSLQF